MMEARNWSVIWTLCLAGLSTATPTVSFPINSQVPPVARMGKPFSFVFSPSTFSSSSPPITYSLRDPPRWLSIDGEARRLYGTPEEEDVTGDDIVGIPISLVATDISGSTAHQVTLVVTEKQAPIVKVPLSSQKPTFGTFSAPSTILCKPDTVFTFQLAPDTFLNPAGNRLSYYAIAINNTPLPAWISFDPDKLLFTGRTPPFDSLITPPQTFALQLIGSDIQGFSATAIRLDMVVSAHELTVEPKSIELNATAGDSLIYKLPKDGVRVDGKPTDDVEIVSTLGMPSWLVLDKDRWELTGTPPDTTTSTAFTVVLRDAFSDTLNMTVSVELDSEAEETMGMFNQSLPPLTLMAGQHFSLDLNPYLSEPQDVHLSVSGPDASWIQMDEEDKQIFGDVPINLTEPALDIDIVAQSKSTAREDTAQLKLQFQKSADNTKITVSSTVPVTVQTPTHLSETSSQARNARNRERTVVLIALLVPVGLLSAVLLCTFIWFLLNRRNGKRLSRMGSCDISPPLSDSHFNNGDSSRNVSHFWGQKQHELIHPAYSPGRLGDARLSPAGLFPFHPAMDFLTPRPSPSPPAARSLIRPVRDTSSTGVRASWLTSAAPGAWRAGKEVGKSKSRSYLSDTSIHEDSRQIRPNTSADLPENARKTSFRGALELHVPSFHGDRSIQPTPEIFYRVEASSEHVADKQAQELLSQPTCATCVTAPLRIQKRLAHYAPAPASPVDEFGSGWLRAEGAKGGAGWFVQEVKDKASLSTSTVDTFAYKRGPKKMSKISYPQPWQSKSGSGDDSPVLQPLAKRPVTRRGHNTSRWFGGNADGRRSRTPTSSTTDAGSGFASMWKSPTLPLDSLRVSYQDLVNDSAFHPSKTWVTLPASAAGEDDDAASRPETSSRLNTAKSEANWSALDSKESVSAPEPLRVTSPVGARAHWISKNLSRFPSVRKAAVAAEEKGGHVVERWRGESASYRTGGSSGMTIGGSDFAVLI